MSYGAWHNVSEPWNTRHKKIIGVTGIYFSKTHIFISCIVYFIEHHEQNIAKKVHVSVFSYFFLSGWVIFGPKSQCKADR